MVQELLPLPPVPYAGRIHPLYLFKLVVRFFVDLFVASFQVAAIALNPRRLPRGAVIGAQTRSASDLYLTLTAQITTLVPGSVVPSREQPRSRAPQGANAAACAHDLTADRGARLDAAGGQGARLFQAVRW